MSRFASSPLTFSRIIRIILASALLGAAISFLLNGATMDAARPKILATGALIGAWPAIFALSFEAMFRKTIERFTESTGRALRALMFLAAGTIGYMIGSTLAQVFIWRQSPDLGRSVRLDSLVLAGSIAMAIGIAFYTYEILRSRLEQSVAQLKEREFAEKELELARSIQRRLLPPSSIEALGYRVESRNVAAQYVAGDFYDVFQMGDGTLGLVVADVAGKGIGASLIMATVKAVLPLIAAGKSVEETLAELNARLHRDLARREFVALAYAHYDPVTLELRIGNAGLPDPWIIRRNGEVLPLQIEGPRLPLGVRPNLRYAASTLKLSAGDRLLLYSDGLPEAPTSEGEPLGYEELGNLIQQRGGDPGAWLDELLAAVRERTSETIEDDWTALLLEATPESREIPTIESVAPGIERIIPSISRTV